jgi:glycosyltransferase involved in cell wall biosynthesis
MRILYFTQDYTTHDHRFLTSLAESGHEVFSLRLERRGVQKEDRPLPPQVEQIGWRGGQGPVTRRDFPALLLELRQILRRIQPDVVHAGPVQSAAFLAALTGFKPLVTMSWGSDLLKGAAGMPGRTRFTLKRTSILLGDCQAVQQKAAEYHFPAERTVLFPWGVDLSRFSPGQNPAQRAELGWEDSFTLLTLRAWEPLYGVDIVARAFALAAAQLPDLRLFMLGDGSLGPQLRQILQRAEVLDRVLFGGQISQTRLAHYYHAADLYISASHSDGSSVSLMEALACGCPVIVSDIPGNREWITPGVEGWLFPDGEHAALAELIIAAAKTRQHLPEMSRAARSLAERRADWRVNFQKLLNAYELAINFAKARKS